MIFCNNCGKQLEDGTAFCDNCGAKLEQPQFDDQTQSLEQYQAAQQAQQSQPVQPTEPQFNQYAQPVQPTEPQFAPQAQQVQPTEPQFNQFAQQAQPQFTQQPQPQFTPQPQPAFAGANTTAAVKKPMNKKILIIGAAAAAAVVVALILVFIFVFAGGGSSQNYLYLKDNEIYISNNGAKGWELTNKLDKIDPLYDYNTYSCKISEDGNRIFYPDKSALYYKNTHDEKGEATKIASKVYNYDIDAAGSKVLYFTGDHNLYLYSVAKEDKEKIASDLASSSFRYNDDFSKIAYRTADNSLYLNINGSEKVKVDSEVSSWYASDDFGTFVYIKNGTLYKKNVSDEDKEKIASDVDSIREVYFDGGLKIYYIKTNESTISYWDCVIDDLADSDANMTQPEPPEYPEYPEYPDYPFSFDYDSDAEYKKAKEEYDKKVKEIEDAYDKALEKYEADNDKYWEEYSAYSDKLTRDELRKSLKEKTSTVYTYSLYYFNGTDETKLCDNYNTSYLSTDVPVMIYSQQESSETPVKLKMSEINGVYDVEYALEYPSNSNTEYKWFIASEGNSNEAAINDIYSCIVSDDGKTLYYIVAEDTDNKESEDSTSEEKFTLYKAEVSNGTVSGETVIDTEISSGYGFSILDNKIIYEKDYDSKNQTASFYYDGELIDDDMYADALPAYQDGTFYYFTDYSSTSGKATLNCKKVGGETTKIKDDVSEFCLLPDGSVLFIYDYSKNSQKGELHLYRNGNSEKLDDDVERIISLYNKNARYKSHIILSSYSNDSYE